MKKRTKTEKDELRAEYDLKKLLRGGVRGKYARRYRSGTTVAVLDPDVAEAFPDSRAVNEALRLVLKLKDVPVRKRRG